MFGNNPNNMTLQKNSFFLILAFLLLITTGSTSVHNAFGEKVDRAIIQIKTDNLKIDSSDTEACHNCNLLKEDDLIFIELRKNNGNATDQKNKKPDIYKVLKLLKSMHLDLNSDKVLYRYLDENGEYKNLTVREHNEYALYKILNPNKPLKIIPGGAFMEGYAIRVLNKLIVQKKHGIVNGYNDKTLQKLRRSGLISNALPLCKYTKYGASGVLTNVTAEGVSNEDNKKILDISNLPLSKGGYFRSYNTKELTRKDMNQLLQILCESTTVKSVNVSCYSGPMVNH